MFLTTVIYIIITFALVGVVWLIPSIYEIGSFSRVYDLYALVSEEYKITSPTNILSKYFPSPNIQTVTNVTYNIDATTNTIKLKINNIDYIYPITVDTTKQIVFPILLSSR